MSVTLTFTVKVGMECKKYYTLNWTSTAEVKVTV